MANAGIRQTRAACQVNVADAVAGFDKLNDGIIGKIGTVAKVDVVQVLSQLANGGDGAVRDVFTLGQDEVA
jgi:hypothetical protein